MLEAAAIVAGYFAVAGALVWLMDAKAERSEREGRAPALWEEKQCDLP